MYFVFLIVYKKDNYYIKKKKLKLNNIRFSVVTFGICFQF